MSPPHARSATALALLLISSSSTVLGQVPQQASLPTIPQDSAESACKAVLASLAQGQGGAFWAMMPETYQQDVQSTMRSLARKVPTELWNGTIDFLASVRDVLKSKKQFILDHPMLIELNLGPSKEQMAEALDTVAAILDVAVGSNLATAKNAREIDMEKFFVSTASEILGRISTMDNMWSQLDMLKVETVGDPAESETTLRISFAGVAFEEPWCKVDGKWVPARLAAVWDDRVARVNEHFAHMEIDLKTRIKISGMLGLMRGIFTQVINAEDQDNFNAAVAAITAIAAGIAAQMFR